MKCIICKQGDLQTGTTTVTLERSGTTLVFKDVPARVCENCGEAYVEDEVTKALLNEAESTIAAGVEVDVRHFKAA